MSSLRIRSLSILLVIALFTACGKHKKKAVTDPNAQGRNDYHFGQIVRFGRGGDSAKYLRGGWGPPEQTMTWTNARFAELVFALPESMKPLKLRMSLNAFVSPPSIPFQSVEVRVNDEPVAEWQVFEERADYIAIISPDLANHEQMFVSLRIPQANSPRALNLSDDTRLLGVSCSELEVTEVDQDQAEDHVKEAADKERQLVRDAYTYGTVVDMGAGVQGERYKVTGWYPAEKEFTWTGSEAAILEMKIQPTSRPLILKMRLAGMTAPGARPFQPTKVYANDEQIADWQVGLPADFSARIPPALAMKGGTLRVALLAGEAASPKQLEVGDDWRILGVRCSAFVITEALSDQDVTPTPSPTARRR